MKKGIIAIIIIILLALSITGGTIFYGITQFRIHENPMVVKDYTKELENARFLFPVEELHYKNLNQEDLYAWFIPKALERSERTNIREEKDKTIILFPGKGGNLHTNLQTLEYLHKYYPYNITAFDYPGTGLSSGTNTKEASVKTIIALVNHLNLKKGIKREQIVFYAQGIGAYFALEGAKNWPEIPLILDSPLTNAREYLSRKYNLPIPGGFLKDNPNNFDNTMLVSVLPNPKLFLHGRENKTVTWKQEQKLFNAAAEPKDKAWFSGEHILITNPFIMKEVWEKVMNFTED